jgi:hypothetical protein
MAFAASEATGKDRGGNRPDSPTRVQKFVRMMLVFMIGIALVGVPVTQAATALPWQRPPSPAAFWRRQLRRKAGLRRRRNGANDRFRTGSDKPWMTMLGAKRPFAMARRLLAQVQRALVGAI